MTTSKIFIATGKRKSSVARVWLIEGTGKILVNERDILDYFALMRLVAKVNEPFICTETIGKYDVIAKIHGGGLVGQAEALRHGIALTLDQINPEFRPQLRAKNLITRDSRVKERKKYGLKAARRAPQFSKR